MRDIHCINISNENYFKEIHLISLIAILNYSISKLVVVRIYSIYIELQKRQEDRNIF